MTIIKAQITNEAKLMEARTGLRWRAWARWMRHVGITSIMDLRVRYPEKKHADCMELAIAELETFICEG